MCNPFGIIRFGGQAPAQTGNDDAVGAGWRCIRIGKRLAIRRAAGLEGCFTRLPSVVIRREHRCVAQGEDVFEHGFIGLHCAHALPPRLETPPQRVALRLRTLQTLGEDVALPAALFEFNAKAPAAGQMPDEMTNEPPEPGH